jgi:hypothetical protein
MDNLYGTLPGYTDPLGTDYFENLAQTTQSVCNATTTVRGWGGEQFGLAKEHRVTRRVRYRLQVTSLQGTDY